MTFVHTDFAFENVKIIMIISYSLLARDVRRTSIGRPVIRFWFIRFLADTDSLRTSILNPVFGWSILRYPIAVHLVRKSDFLFNALIWTFPGRAIRIIFVSLFLDANMTSIVCPRRTLNEYP